MKLSASNIGWAAEDDNRIYKALAERGFQGLEIAPTRIFPQPAYEKLEQAAAFAVTLKADYGLTVPSMQSIWFGRQENIFGSLQDRELLIAHTQKAVDFAAAIGCKNLVFGCPRNRAYPEGKDPNEALAFFSQLGEYAHANRCTIALEANPPIYNTNYLNNTAEAFAAAKCCGNGVSVNLDIGTVIQNGESISSLTDILPAVSHIHISEPYLAPIEERPVHRELADLLRACGYDGFVSVEMKAQPFDDVIRILDYVSEVFA